MRQYSYGAFVITVDGNGAGISHGGWCGCCRLAKNLEAAMKIIDEEGEDTLPPCR